MSYESQKELESTYVMHTFGRKPVELVSGQGMRVEDAEGGSYLDFIAGIGCICLGHSHPAWVEAVSRQAGRLVGVSNYYYVEGRGELSAKLSSMLNHAGEAGGAKAGKSQPWQSFYANSGAEANECAIKLARLWAKQHGSAQLIVTLEHSFHGRTLATLAATAQPAKQEAFAPLPAGFIATPINDIAALEDLFEQRGDDICAVMVECVQGESGVHPCTAEFLQAARSLAHANNALLICDEIQCGIYRCGSYPFGFQHFRIVPDIVTIAKGVASGFPIGICAARAEVARAFSPGDHGSTFGGNPLAIAAAQATLDILEAQDIAEHVHDLGVYFRERLDTLPHVTEVRGLGLMCACDVEEGIDAGQLVTRALDEGLLLNSTGPHTLRFLPPLVCEASDIDVLMEKLQELLKSSRTA